MNLIPAITTRRGWWAAAGGIALLTSVVYARSLWNGFVEWDDGLLIVQNPFVTGLSLHNLWMAFTSYDPELYIPLTFLSYQLNFALGGLQPFGYHLVNLLLHIGNALMVAWLADVCVSSDKRLAISDKHEGHALTASRFPLIAFVTGLLFAIHPMNTEIVAWASARKDVLSAFFFLLSLIAYVHVVAKSDKRLVISDKHESMLLTACRLPLTAYIFSLLFFLLALLAKVSAIILPGVLLLLPLLERRLPDRRSFIAVLPYLLLSILFGIIALFGKSGRNTGLLLEKALIGARAIVFYLWHVVWPVDFSVLYPFTHAITVGNPSLLLSVLFVVAVTVVAALLYRRWPALLVAWLVTILCLLPSFTNFAKGYDIQRDVYLASDRYAYLAVIPLFLLMGYAAKMLMARWRVLSIALLSLILAALSVLSYQQSLTWFSTETLFRHVLAVVPDSHVAYTNIGVLLYRQGKGEEALNYFAKSLTIRPNNAAFYNLGVIAMENGLPDKAEELLRRALTQRPTDSGTLTKLGVLLLRRGALGEATDLLEQAVVAKAPPVEAFLTLGEAYERAGRTAEAAAMFRQAVAMDPENAEARARVGRE